MAADGRAFTPIPEACMSNDFFADRDLLGELISLVNEGQVFSDIHIEQDALVMIKTPRGWAAAGAEVVTADEMTPLLAAIDEDWEDKIIDSAIDRSYVLTNCRLRCNLFRLSGGKKVAGDNKAVAAVST